ncbi:HEAT repeat domain-containing protein [Bacillus ndiopicus]|uniref:HEAT repeat domain-containing protein n=1 Tax=Bacillus ndiopicus TaxID=1347368 RepID=UPI001E51132A|nr:HEAT repeat domain-containing protein [Bacillus ndiopicus]
MMIELKISTLLWIIAVLLFMLLLFLLYIIIQHNKEGRFNRRRDAYVEAYTGDWYDFLIRDTDLSASVIPHNKAQVTAVERIFLSYLKNLQHPEIEKKIQDFANVYLKDFYIEDLKSRLWSIRMNALYRIADFKINSLMDNLESFEKRNISKEEYFQLFKIYSVLQPSKFLEKLDEVQITYSESEYRRLFILLSDNIFTQVFDNFYHYDKNIQFAIIDTAAVKRNMLFISKLKELLADDSLEIKIRALKGLYEIGIVDEIETYIPFVSSEVWEVRLMVAKIFRYAPLSYTYTYLEQLIQDENWWVRSQAAKTIIEDRHGVEMLQQFIVSADDQFAVELAQETIMRRQGGK